MIQTIKLKEIAEQVECFLLRKLKNATDIVIRLCQSIQPKSKALFLFLRQKYLVAKREKRGKSKSSAGYNQKIGEEFLAQKAKKDGVFETASGLQYKIVEEVEGLKPDEYSTVVIHQRALLLNGTILEDTYRKNEPDEVRLEELIEGLQEGLQLMGKGSRYKFWVPADLAWGRKGTSNKIPPFAVLSFDIRLVDVLNS